jgi:8-oxo-dGTP diphosphatase
MPTTAPDSGCSAGDGLPGKLIDVAVGVIRNPRGQVLIARRLAGTHLAGFWEFPGGKIEPGESVRDGLVRELREELGIDVAEATPLIRVRHDYPERRVSLDVWEVTDFAGEPFGRQGQAVRWVSVEDLPGIALPEANRPIATAVRLPDFYAILEAERPDADLVMANLHRLADNGIRFIQCRAKALQDQPGFPALVSRVVCFCREHDITVLLNGDPQQARELGADGVHLNSARMKALTTRPLGRDLWVGASCHDEAELQQAARIGADFAVLGPVAKTISHTDAAPLGWDRFSEMVRLAKLPVYALGGVASDDLERARHSGARGVSAVRAFLVELH